MLFVMHVQLNVKTFIKLTICSAGMGLLSKLFGKRKIEKIKLKLSPEELAPWFEQRALELREQLNSRFEQLVAQIMHARARFRDAVEQLEHAKLMNEAISAKERAFMEGNRAALVKRGLTFLERTAPACDIDGAKAHCSRFVAELEQFTKGSARAIAILGNFFGDRLREFHAATAVLVAAENSLAAFVQERQGEKLTEIGAAIERLNNELERKAKLEDELEKLEAQSAQLKTLKSGAQLAIDRFKRRKEWAELEESRAALAALEANARELKAEFGTRFATVAKLLRKFAKLKLGDEQKAIESYLSDPLGQLLLDPELKIVSMIGEAIKALRAGQLELEQGKADRIAAAAEFFDRQRLLAFVLRHNELELRQAELRRQLASSQLPKELEQLNYELEHLSQQQKKCAARLSSLNRELDAIELYSPKKAIERELAALGFEIEIEL